MPLTELQKARLTLDRYAVGQTLMQSAGELCRATKAANTSDAAVAHLCKSIRQSVDTIEEITREIKS